MKTRRQFLMRGTAVVVAAALPVTALAAKPVFIGVDWGFEPSRTAFAMLRTYWDAEQEIMRVVGIPFEDVYLRGGNA
jgi:hypothetical protein